MLVFTVVLFMITAANGHNNAGSLSKAGIYLGAGNFKAVRYARFALKPMHSSPRSVRHTEKFQMAKESNHVYYKSRMLHGLTTLPYWKDMAELKRYGVVHDHKTSKNYHIPMTIKLQFVFLFYGHEIEQVTITPYGYLYMSTFMHNLMSYSQYIAPLMAAFDLSLSNRSHVYYSNTENSITVWWKNVYLNKQAHVGDFDFQTTLHQNGTIWFVYKRVPVTLTKISELYHVVKIGLADAFYTDREVNFGFGKGHHRMIQQYHQVKIKMANVHSNTVIIIDPLTTCLTLKSCQACMTANVSFSCGWCDRLSRCSDGMDRMRQQWRENFCHLKNLSQCPIVTSSLLTTDAIETSILAVDNDTTEAPPVGSFLVHDLRYHHQAVASATIAAMVAGLLILIFVIVSWMVYAYRNPSSRLGQLCIEYRPSQLTQKFNRVRFWRSRGTGHTDHYHVSVNGGNAFI